MNMADVVRLAIATVPIFHPVNKLQKQMHLKPEMHSAPVERLEHSLADLF